MEPEGDPDQGAPWEVRVVAALLALGNAVLLCRTVLGAGELMI